MATTETTGRILQVASTPSNYSFDTLNTCEKRLLNLPVMEEFRRCFLYYACATILASTSRIDGCRNLWHTIHEDGFRNDVNWGQFVVDQLVEGIRRFKQWNSVWERDDYSRTQDKRPVEPSQPGQVEACPNVRFDTDLFTSIEEYQRAFYSRVTYGHGGSIISIVRGVEIQLDPESICHILDITPVGLRVYESKAWPTMADAQGMGKLFAHSLTVSYKVSYLEAFLIDSIMMGRWIDVGYLMMMHMIACCENSTRVFPYGCFLTRVFKDAGVHLSRKQDFEAPSSYDTYDEQSLGWMKFEKAPDGSWIRRAKQPVPQPRGHGKVHPAVEERDFDHREPEFDIPPLQSEGGQFEVTFSKPMMSEPIYTTGPSSQPSFTKSPHAQTSPHQAPNAPDHAPWMDLAAQISSLGTRMEELTVVSDMLFYSMEDRMDHYQTGFTYRFECLQ
ncbi:hypothetical protein AAG906_017707 [Vitis piasezkii]